ncbi:hypothetical protein P4V39_22880 [Brevibacillus borstelensis]|uniref:hypothetical protein n=1 Tax=Brevibacillus borstelensis TaxID=45462 RepID=UPI002E1A687F|nr:hypothetical protein [Brevibacillus borstelensis]
MSQQLPDFPAYVEQTEPIRQQHLQPLAFDTDEDSDQLEWVARDVIEELELIIDARATMFPEEFREEIREQAKRLLK